MPPRPALLAVIALPGVVLVGYGVAVLRAGQVAVASKSASAGTWTLTGAAATRYGLAQLCPGLAILLAVAAEAGPARRLAYAGVALALLGAFGAGLFAILR